jgi:hypothetical protein
VNGQERTWRAVVWVSVDPAGAHSTKDVHERADEALSAWAFNGPLPPESAVWMHTPPKLQRRDERLPAMRPIACGSGGLRAQVGYTLWLESWGPGSDPELVAAAARRYVASWLRGELGAQPVEISPPVLVDAPAA